MTADRQQTVLSDDDVSEVCDLYDDGWEPPEIAEDLGFSVAVVRQVIDLEFDDEEDDEEEDDDDASTAHNPHLLTVS